MIMGFVDENICDLIDDLSSMRLCFKCDCVVKGGMCWKIDVWEYMCALQVVAFRGVLEVSLES
jgi:hypothetical protein